MPDEAALLCAIIMNLVDHPDEVRVEQTMDEKGVLLCVHLNVEDRGRAIGHQGNMANALRTVMRGVGKRRMKAISVKIMGDKQEEAANVYDPLAPLDI